MKKCWFTFLRFEWATLWLSCFLNLYTSCEFYCYFCLRICMRCLRIEEQNIELQQKATDNLVSTTTMMYFPTNCSRGSSIMNRGRGRFSNRGTFNNFLGKGCFPRTSQGSFSSDRGAPSRSFCQIFNKSGHNALDCYHPMDYTYQGRHPIPTESNFVFKKSIHCKKLIKKEKNTFQNFKLH